MQREIMNKVSMCLVDVCILGVANSIIKRIQKICLHTICLLHYHRCLFNRIYLKLIGGENCSTKYQNHKQTCHKKVLPSNFTVNSNLHYQL